MELPKLLTVYLNPSNYTRDSFVLHPLVVLDASMAVTLAPEAAGTQRAVCCCRYLAARWLCGGAAAAE